MLSNLNEHVNNLGRILSIKRTSTVEIMASEFVRYIFHVAFRFKKSVIFFY